MSRTKDIFNRACQNEKKGEAVGLWNDQILSIEEENLNSSLIKLFENNMATLVVKEATVIKDDENLLSCSFRLVWQRLLRMGNSSG